MALLIVTLGTLLFVGVHLIPVMPAWRTALVGRVGEGPYKAGFALLTAVGLVAAIWAYRYTAHAVLWQSPPPVRALTAILMLVAMFCFAGAKGTPWFKRVVRHPMLWGIGLLGVAHLLSNGDVAGIVLFGGLALFGFVWQPLTDRRDAKVEPAAFADTARTTSFWPFARWHARSDPITMRPLIAGAIVYVVLILLHPWLFGMPVIVW